MFMPSPPASKRLVFFNGNNWSDIFAFDVLQCIGVAMVLFAPIVTYAPTWL